MPNTRFKFIIKLSIYLVCLFLHSFIYLFIYLFIYFIIYYFNLIIIYILFISSSANLVVDNEIVWLLGSSLPICCGLQLVSHLNRISIYIFTNFVADRWLLGTAYSHLIQLQYSHCINHIFQRLVDESQLVIG